jgi:PAS domain S-box-containing protein
MNIQTDPYEAGTSAEGRYRLLVESISEYAIYMLNADGTVANWNAGAQRFKGYRADEIVGQHFARFYRPEDQAAGIPQRNLDRAEQDGRFEEEGWRVRKDGSHFWASVVIDRILDPNGRLIGFAKLTRDNTERREAQLQLDRAREALFQSQKMEAIGQLTGGVAHDFNNLLMAILGSLDIVSQRIPPDPRITPFLENAIKGAQRGAALTQRMLAFARRQELQTGPVDVAETVEGMSGILARAIGPNVLVTSRLSAGLPPALTDKAQLESALLNLAVNARDAMPDGGSIVIAAREASAPADGKLVPGRYVVLGVTDDGEGMDAETLARAAEPFFTTKGVGKGTGLGLSMVQGLAEQTGGGFMLRSTQGAGTTAELWLPIAAEAPKVEEEALPPAEHQFQRRRILVVDDDALVLLNTVTMTEDLGHEVLEASNGREALDIMRREAVDLVITDYAMPQMNGGQLAEAIVAQWPGLPIIVATGYSEMPDELRGKFERLGKPFWSQDLKAAIERSLG